MSSSSVFFSTGVVSSCKTQELKQTLSVDWSRARGALGGISTGVKSFTDLRLPIYDDSVPYISSTLNSFPSSDTIFASVFSPSFLVGGIV
ncbi:hypothetical protein Hanom_Chr01g00010081 [Helianthus anomalus]